MSTAIDTAETEQELVTTARSAISNCNWTVGECAAQWTKRYARGRTDADFGEMVGLSGDQIYQRRRVWETFADVRDSYSQLRWSHFYVALTWNDAPECLGWAEENQATVAEMKAWRRMQHGEDLTVDVESSMDLAAAALDFSDPAVHRQADFFGEEGDVSSDSMREHQAGDDRVEAADGRGAEKPYAPFRSDAASPPPEQLAETTEPLRLSPEQTFKKMASNFERCTRILSDELLEQFAELPEKVRLRFITAVENLNDRVSRLS